MKLLLSYAELSDLVCKNTGKEITFSFGGVNTLRASMALSFSFFNANPTVDVVFDKVESNHIFLSLSSTLMGLSKIVDNTIPSLLEKFPFVKLDGEHFDVDLAGIDKLRPLLQTMDLTGISFQNSTIEISFRFRQ